MASAVPTTNAPEWTVSELSGALRRTLEDRFARVRVRGELGKVTYHGGGHVYVDLKDEAACLSGVVWRRNAQRLRIKLEQGMEVVATGQVTTHDRQSKYQLAIETIEPAGVGALMALLDQRRRALAAEGLFATERKRPLPLLPQLIGVVSSPTGAVIRDILHRLADRFPRPVLLWPVRVQGETCGPEVAAAITGLNALQPGPIGRPDVIIVARGGGSLEDLWGFNDEAVVRAAAASAIPIVSAIGHETDWCLLDQVADLRAPTPTGAAELVVPVRAQLVERVRGLGARNEDATLRLIVGSRTELRSASRALPGTDGILGPRRQRLDLANARLGPALLSNARAHEAQLRRSAQGLASHAPRVELARARERLSAWSGRLDASRQVVARSEQARVERCRERVAELAGRVRRTVAESVGRRRGRLDAAGGLLASLGYRSVLERGFALVRDQAGRAVHRAAEIAAGQALEIELADGRRRVVAGPAALASRGPRRADPLAQGKLFDI